MEIVKVPKSPTAPVTEYIHDNSDISDDEPVAPLVTEQIISPTVQPVQPPTPVQPTPVEPPTQVEPTPVQPAQSSLLALSKPQKKYKYKCEMCGKSFKDKTKYTHHTEKRKTLCISHNQLVDEIKMLKTKKGEQEEIINTMQKQAIERDTTIQQRDVTIGELETSLDGEKKEHTKTKERLNEQIDDAMDDGEYISVTLRRTQHSLDKYIRKYDAAKVDISKRRAKIIKLKGMYTKLDNENKYLSDKILQFEYNSDESE